MTEETQDKQRPSDANNESRNPNPVRTYAEQFKLLEAAEPPNSFGFSARLNMLWDLSGAGPSQIEGRATGVMAINREWREAEVKRWLHQDILPSRIDLHNMVKFLVAQLPDKHDINHWEAFLIYGAPIVASPVDRLMYRDDQARRDIASMIFAQLTHEYGIPPSAYDADRVFQRCLTLMHKFNIYELRDFQSGHMEAFKSFLFSED